MKFNLNKTLFLWALSNPQSETTNDTALKKGLHWMKLFNIYYQ